MIDIISAYKHLCLVSQTASILLAAVERNQDYEATVTAGSHNLAPHGDRNRIELDGAYEIIIRVAPPGAKVSDYPFPIIPHED